MKDRSDSTLKTNAAHFQSVGLRNEKEYFIMILFQYSIDIYIYIYKQQLGFVSKCIKNILLLSVNCPRVHCRVQLYIIIFTDMNVIIE